MLHRETKSLPYTHSMEPKGIAISNDRTGLWDVVKISIEMLSSLAGPGVKHRKSPDLER